jgi:hypothetical protein
MYVHFLVETTCMLLANLRIPDTIYLSDGHPTAHAAQMLHSPAKNCLVCVANSE